MGITKNALIRYKVLDGCFRNPGRKYFIGDLIEACNDVLLAMNPDSTGISRRQILDDITFMESAEGWSIELERHRENRKVYYRYADVAFSINNMPLNDLEVDQLQSAIEILSQFKGMPQFEWIHELVPKLKQGARTEKNRQPIIDFDSNQYLKGIERLGDLYNAILYKKVLKIEYRPFDSDASINFTIHPYYLKQYNNRWFLFGFNSDNGKYNWNLPLDRIVNVTEVKGKYEKNTEIDWQEYFEDMIGVTRPDGATIETVKLRFDKKAAWLVESKPLHGSQKSKWTDKGILDVELKVLINPELENRLLSFGEELQVLSPSELKMKIKKRLSASVANY